jgi:hypothetical protein
MEEEKLDQFFKDKLDAVETSVPEDAWAFFSEKLKNAELEDNTSWEKNFDLNIYRKLNQFVLPSNKKYGWAFFNDYYARVKRNERKIIWFKAMEVTLATLLFITCLQIDVLLPNRFYQLPLKESGKVIAENDANSSLLAEGNNKKNEVADLINQKYLRNLAPIDFIGYKNELDKTKQHALNFYVTPIPASEQTLLNQMDYKVSLPSFTKVDQIATLKSMNIPVSPRKIYINNILDFGKWHLTLLSGLDGDNVFTPENVRFKVPQTIRNSSGFHLGFLLSEGAKRLETGFGFIFAQKEYNAPRVTFIQGSLRDGYTTEQLKKIQLSLLQIPVFTRFNIIHRDRWRMYASFGATAQLTLSANYFIVHPGLFPSSVSLTGKSNSVYQNLEEGLMQGGTLLDNVYLSMDAGIGAEKMVSQKTSLFIQAGYQQFIGHISNGIGPYNDRISTLSFQSGVRINLFHSKK